MNVESTLTVIASAAAVVGSLEASALTRIDPGLLNGIDPLTEYPPCIVW